MADLNTITKAELIKDLPSKNSIGATDLYLLQTSVQSFKLQHSDLVANLVDNSTITVDGSNKLTVSNNVIQAAYPIGSIYMNATNASNPASLLGFGTWTKFGEGRVLIGEGTGTDTNTENKTFTAGETSGEYRHTLNENEMPSHIHAVNTGGVAGGSVGVSQGGNHSEGGSAGSRRGGTAQPTGGDQPHNNIQPYITVYMWKRTA